MARLMRDILNETDSKPVKSGDLVRAARKRFNLTQDEVCQLTGLKRENLSAIENGRVQMTVYYAELFVLYSISTQLLFYFRTVSMNGLENC